MEDWAPPKNCYTINKYRHRQYTSSDHETRSYLMTRSHLFYLGKNSGGEISPMNKWALGRYIPISLLPLPQA